MSLLFSDFGSFYHNSNVSFSAVCHSTVRAMLMQYTLFFKYAGKLNILATSR
jgi:hypothetical protein